jgi:hypothetical protein
MSSDLRRAAWILEDYFGHNSDCSYEPGMSGPAGDVCDCGASAAARRVDEIIRRTPEIVCLSGSTRFKDAYRRENARLTLDGKIVLSVGFFHHSDGVPDAAPESAMGENGEWKEDADHLHLRKIDLADRLHVINVDGYVGESTREEIEYARETDTKVTWLEPEGAE